MSKEAIGPDETGSGDLERLWAEHLDGEFVAKDVEATLATMVDDAYVNHMPVNTGGRGKDELRVFYRDEFISSWPNDLEMTPRQSRCRQGSDCRRAAGAIHTHEANELASARRRADGSRCDDRLCRGDSVP